MNYGLPPNRAQIYICARMRITYHSPSQLVDEEELPKGSSRESTSFREQGKRRDHYVRSHAALYSSCPVQSVCGLAWPVLVPTRSPMVLRATPCRLRDIAPARSPCLLLPVAVG